jgi:TolA-binding protein
LRAGRLTALALFVCLPCCASYKPSEYARLDAAAARAYSAGRYQEAARRWEEAARSAKLSRNKSEARYLMASSLLRGGMRSEAVAAFDRVVADDPKGPRAARAAHDRALTLIALGQVERGYQALEAMLRAYPESGVAAGALRRYLSHLQRSGEGAVQQYLERSLPSLEKTELGEAAHYAYAESLERDEKTEEARAQYLLVAKNYPYPRGALWDDALFHAAELEAKAGDPRAAIAHLEEMLAKRETAYMSGSYERRRYAEARFRIAELFRDALGDSASARQHFERVFADHKTSRLRDEALWNAALLASRSGDRAGACRDLETLAAAIPDSRYVPCAERLCPTGKGPGSSGQCRGYILRGAGLVENGR